MHTLWQKLFMQRYLAGKVVRHEVEKMSKNFFHRQDLSNVDMENFIEFVDRFDPGSDVTTLSEDRKLKVSLFLRNNLKLRTHS